MGRSVSIVDNNDLDRWSKVEIEGICKKFGYIAVGTIWFKMPSVNLEHANFHEVVDDDVAMFMTDIVHGHEQIHIYVDHLVDEPKEIVVEDIEPIEVVQPSEEPTVDQALDAIQVDDSVDYNDHDSYYEDEVDSKGDANDHYYDPIKVDAAEFYYRRASKEPIIEEQHEDPVNDVMENSTESRGSELEEELDLHPTGRSFDDDNSDSWDNREDVHDEPVQMGARVMNSD